MPTHSYRSPHGPFVAEQIRDGDRYELSNGHPIYCAPAGKSHAGSNLIGARVLGTDPDVEWAGIDAGFSPEPGELRAPDIAVGRVGEPPEGGKGWIPGVPPLAVEYAGPGQDEGELKRKIAELLAAGTRWVWVARLIGPRRVEVHSAGRPVRIARLGERLEAPGVLRNPILVEALFDARAADEAALRNLLQRHGYADLEAVRTEGKEQGRAEGKAEGKVEGKAEGKAEGRAEGLSEGQLLGQAQAVLQLLEGRGLAVTASQRARILACRDGEQLRAWLLRAAIADAVADLLD